MATRGRKKEGLSPSERMVLALCAQHGADGMAITKQSLSIAIGKCARTATRALHYLIVNGLIERHAQRDGSGATLANLYIVTEEGWKALQAESDKIPESAKEDK